MINIYYWTRNSLVENITINNEITMLIGPNGSGKTILLRQIRSMFEDHSWNHIDENSVIENDYMVYLYDNVESEKFRKQEWLEEDIFKLAKTFENSEGQDIYDFLTDRASTIGKRVKKAKELGKKGIFLLFDGLDSRIIFRFTI